MDVKVNIVENCVLGQIFKPIGVVSVEASKKSRDNAAIMRKVPGSQKK